MPPLFSWSCKRNYKNGYVWNDLSKNDVIYPSDGVRVRPQGLQDLPRLPAATDRFQHLRMTDRSPTKPPPLALPAAHSHKQYVDGYRDGDGEDPKDDEQHLGYPYHRRGAAGARLAR